MHIHYIHNEKHEHFLAERRRDPITGERMREGDEVVFCAGCRSAFLVETWEYLGKKHCGQEKTLNYVPSSLRLRVKRKIGKLLFDTTKKHRLPILSKEKKTESENFETVRWLSVFFFGAISSISAFNQEYFAAVILGTQTLFPLMDLYHSKESLRPSLSFFRIYERALVFKNYGFWQSSFWLDEIEKIEFHHNKLNGFDFVPHLIIQLKNGQRKQKRIPSSYLWRKECLKALSNISKRIKIELHVSKYEDISYAKHLKNEQQAGFVIEELKH